MELHPSLYGEKLQKLQKGQKIMTDMFKHFDSLCRKYGILYWAIGGTLIGTVRKDKILENGERVGGWIPFDGDVDVAMMRNDYEKFKCYSHELPSTMFLQDSHTDCRYKATQFAKLRDINSHYLNYWPKNCHHGLQIDIFLWDSDKETVYYNKCIDKYEERYNFDVIFPLKDMEFEGFNIKVPNKYDEYCKLNFGTWPMPHLPIEKRLPHEGDIEPDFPHPDDIVLYHKLYK